MTNAMDVADVAYLTCELKSRDLDSRLLIAAELLKAGVSVVVGQQWSIFANLDTAPKGAVLFKTASKVMAENMKIARSYGHRVLAADEECFAYRPTESNRDGFIFNVSREAVDPLSLFICQSQQQEHFLLQEYPKLDGRTFVAGNTRMDLVARAQIYEAEAERLQLEYGPYILFNTNFALANSLWGQNLEEVMSRQDEVQDRSDMLEWEKRNMEAMEEVMIFVHKHMSAHSVVIRPHPAEDPAYWERFAAGNEHIHVVTGTAPFPWILGAEFVVHTNCSTAVYGAALNRNVLNINLEPTSKWSERFISAIVSSHNEPTTEGACLVLGKHCDSPEFVDQFATPLASRIGIINKVLPGWAQARAAFNTAAAINILIPSSVGGDTTAMLMRQWRHKPRGRVAEAKFKCAIDEFCTRLSTCVRAADLDPSRIDVGTLDDSLYLLTPKTRSN